MADAALRLDWAEPGDPPSTDFESVGARPLAKPIQYESLTPEIERELVRRWHANGDERALEWLVGAHRPMVVSMARGLWRGNGTSIAALIEYGMVGLRIAALPARPSKTKKGAIVVFDPDKGRFSTYARHYARNEMQDALAVDPSALNLDFEQKVTTLFEDWKDPVPEQHYEASPEVGEREDDPPLHAGGHKILFRELQRRRPLPPKCRRPLNFWNPPDWAKDQFRPIGNGAGKVKPRNFPKHPRTALELANLSAYHGRYWVILKAFDKVAAEGFEGWEDNDPDPLESNEADFLVASFFRSHALKPTLYKLPMKVLWERWRLGCGRLGIKPKFKMNKGLGLFDKKGHLLPDYDALYAALDEKVKIIRPRKWVPFLCLKPIASIYYMRGTDTQDGKIDAFEVLSWRRYRPKETEEMANAFTEVLPVRLPEGARKELAKIAERRYQSACSLARQAIMALIEKAKKEEAKRAA